MLWPVSRARHITSRLKTWGMDLLLRFRAWLLEGTLREAGTYLVIYRIDGKGARQDTLLNIVLTEVERSGDTTYLVLTDAYGTVHIYNLANVVRARAARDLKRLENSWPKPEESIL